MSNTVKKITCEVHNVWFAIIKSNLSNLILNVIKINTETVIIMFVTNFHWCLNNNFYFIFKMHKKNN